MSSDSKPPTLGWKQSDPKALEFIGKLKDKTAQGKVTWVKFDKDVGFFTKLPNNVLAYFNSTVVPPYEWRYFSVMSDQKVIFQVAKSLSDVLLMMAPDITDGVQSLAHQLFQLVTSKQPNPLDQALDSLNQI